MARKNYTWDHLNPLQLGRLAEYFVKMELTRYGLEIYSSEVDNSGIDFIAKTSSSRYYDFQVKSVREYNYIFFPKNKSFLRDNHIVVIVIFIEKEEPDLFLITSNFWKTPGEILVSRDYEDEESEPDWCINLSKKTCNLLEPYRPEKIINKLK
jgi:hypothetical protein